MRFPDKTPSICKFINRFDFIKLKRLCLIHDRNVIPNKKKRNKSKIVFGGQSISLSVAPQRQLKITYRFHDFLKINFVVSIKCSQTINIVKIHVDYKKLNKKLSLQIQYRHKDIILK